MLRPAVRRARSLVAIALLAPVLAGCGGGRGPGAEDAEGTYKVEVVRSTFPIEQRLAQKAELTLAVRNTDTRAIPNVAVTIDSFQRRDEQEGLADPNRPIWIVDRGPSGGNTACTNTWAL